MFKTYRRIGTIEAREYVVGESLQNISVSRVDNPDRDGGMVCRNPENHDDQWFVNHEFFKDRFVLEEEDKADDVPCHDTPRGILIRLDNLRRLNHAEPTVNLSSEFSRTISDTLQTLIKSEDYYKCRFQKAADELARVVEENFSLEHDKAHYMERANRNRMLSWEWSVELKAIKEQRDNAVNRAQNLDGRLAQAQCDIKIQSGRIVDLNRKAGELENDKSRANDALAKAWDEIAELKEQVYNLKELRDKLHGELKWARYWRDKAFEELKGDTDAGTQ